MFKKYLKKYAPLEIISLSEIYFFVSFRDNLMQQLKRDLYMYMYMYKNN